MVHSDWWDNLAPLQNVRQLDEEEDLGVALQWEGSKEMWLIKHITAERCHEI